MGCKHQQFTYGVAIEGFFSEILQKFCGNLQKYGLLRQESVCGNSTERLRSAKILRKLRNIFCNDPFPSDPISEFLKILGAIVVRRGLAISLFF